MKNNKILTIAINILIWARASWGKGELLSIFSFEATIHILCNLYHMFGSQYILIPLVLSDSFWVPYITPWSSSFQLRCSILQFYMPTTNFYSTCVRACVRTHTAAASSYSTVSTLRSLSGPGHSWHLTADGQVQPEKSRYGEQLWRWESATWIHLLSKQDGVPRR